MTTVFEHSKARLRRILRAAEQVHRDLEEIERLPAPWNWPGSWLGGFQTSEEEEGQETPESVLRMAEVFSMHESELKLAMDLVQEKDLRAGWDSDAAWTTEPDWVRSTPLFESDTVSMRLFVIPPFQLIPLHSHPRMSVYSRLFRGDLHLFSLSLSNERGRLKPSTDLDSAGPIFASCDVKGWQSGSQPTFCLSAVRGNLHELHAGADQCVLLDVFVPPYNLRRRRQFYTPERLTKLPVTRIASQPPSFGALSVDPHHLQAVEVGCVVKLKTILDPANYRIVRVPFTAPSKHFQEDEEDLHP